MHQIGENIHSAFLLVKVLCDRRTKMLKSEDIVSSDAHQMTFEHVSEQQNDRNFLPLTSLTEP